MSIKDLEIGTKLELEVLDYGNSNKNYCYVSQLLDIKDDSNIVIAAPISETRLAFIPNNSKLVIVFNHPKLGIMAYDGILKSKDMHSSIAVYNVYLTGDFYKIQRRDYYRLDAMIDAFYYTLSANAPISLDDSEEQIMFKKSFTKNISGSGACIVTEEEYKKGEHLIIKFVLPDNTEVTARCFVIRSIKADSPSKKYNTGVKFTVIKKQDEDALIKFIFSKQKENLKHKKFFEN